MVVMSSSVALAVNYDSPPPIDQIRPGDTLDYGDPDVKTGTVDGGVRGGFGIESIDWVFFTDIWYVYRGDPLAYESGPRGYGYSEAIYVVDKIEAYTRLWDKPLGDPTWNLIDSNRKTNYNDWTSEEAWVEAFNYNWAAPSYIGFRGTTRHEIQDAELGWDISDNTSDAF